VSHVSGIHFLQIQDLFSPADRALMVDTGGFAPAPAAV